MASFRGTDSQPEGLLQRDSRASLRSEQELEASGRGRTEQRQPLFPFIEYELWLHLAVLIRKGMWSDLWVGKTTRTRVRTGLRDGGVEGGGVWSQVLAGEKSPDFSSWDQGVRRRTSLPLCL